MIYNKHKIKEINMGLKITFERVKQKLTVERTFVNSAGKNDIETIIMEATSGGWDKHKPLPLGKWTIAENPTGNRNYFALFFQDGNINDQFKDGHWRDGIRFGFHRSVYGTGSHGCIMTNTAANKTYADSLAKWEKIQKLIRATPVSVLTYQNIENPRRKDNTVYKIKSYGFIKVVL